jgi:hypothetical protein
MAPEDFYAYLDAAIVLESQEMLRLMNIADFPDMKKDARSKMHRQVYKAAYPNQAKKVVTVEDLKNVLGSVE